MNKVQHNIMQAIILAGGKGERLRPFTEDCPKGMVKIEGKPILEYQIEWLKKNGIKKIIFACGYLSEKIKEYFGDGKDFGLKFVYSVEVEPLGRGGALKFAWKYLSPNEQIIATNGDIYTEIDLSKVIGVHNSKKKVLATMCLFKYKSPYGVVWVDENSQLVTSFDEKREMPYWVNGGVYVFNYEMVNYLPDKGDHEVTTFPELAERKLLQAYTSNEYWKGIDTVKDMNEFAVDSRSLPLAKKLIKV